MALGSEGLSYIWHMQEYHKRDLVELWVGHPGNLLNVSLEQGIIIGEKEGGYFDIHIPKYTPMILCRHASTIKRKLAVVGKGKVAGIKFSF